MSILRQVRAAYEQGHRSVHKRPFEWFFAIVTLGWGVTLMDPYPTFDGPSYVYFRRMATEEVWAYLTIYGGLARLLVLWINGSWYRTAFLRTAASFSSLTLWFLATIAFALAGLGSTGVYTYAAFFVVEFSCMLTAGYETGRLETSQFHKLKERVRQGKMKTRTAIVFGVLGVDRGTTGRASYRT